MVTIPLIGWVAKLGPNRDKLASFSVAKYGPQKDTDTRRTCRTPAKGSKLDGTRITGNDPERCQCAVRPGVHARLGCSIWSRSGDTASKGGVRYYLMDNEPNLWSLTHRDVDPKGIGMDEYRDRLFAYAAMVKSVDPTALVVGPGVVGLQRGEVFRRRHPAGRQRRRLESHAGPKTRTAIEDFFPWVLDQLRAHDLKTGIRSWWMSRRSITTRRKATIRRRSLRRIQLKRNRSTRSLWDPTYKAESWVNDYIDMLPRMKAYVARDIIRA